MTQASELPRWRLALALAALFLSSMCTMGDLVISPIAADIYTAFAASPVALVNLGVTGPALVGLPFGLACGLLCDRFDKKLIMLVGFGIFTVSSVFGIAYVDVRYFVVMRLLATGVGWGITNTAALSILADLFCDEERHAKYVGLYNAAMSAIGALLASCAGTLALDGWTHAYQTYVVAIPVLVMLAVFLPRFPAAKRNRCRSAAKAALDYPAALPSAGESPTPQASVAQSVEEVYGASTSSAAALGRALFMSDDADDVPKGWWHRLAVLCIQVFAVATLYFVIMYLIGLYVSDTGTGDSAFTGYLTSVMTIATAAGSLVFGFAYKHLRDAVYLPALAVIGLVFFALAACPAQPIIVCCLGVAGFMWPFYFCYFYTRCTQIVPAQKRSTSTSIVAAADGLAVSACSYLLTATTQLTGGGVADAYALYGAAMLIACGISALVVAARRSAASRSNATVSRCGRI